MSIGETPGQISRWSNYVAIDHVADTTKELTDHGENSCGVEHRQRGILASFDVMIIASEAPKIAPKKAIPPSQNSKIRD